MIIEGKVIEIKYDKFGNPTTAKIEVNKNEEL